MPDRCYPLTIDRDTDGSYLVSDDTTLVYGAGATIAAALRAYDTALADWRVLTRDAMPVTAVRRTGIGVVVERGRRPPLVIPAD